MKAWKQVFLCLWTLFRDCGTILSMVTATDLFFCLLRVHCTKRSHQTYNNSGHKRWMRSNYMQIPIRKPTWTYGSNYLDIDKGPFCNNWQ